MKLGGVLSKTSSILTFPYCDSEDYSCIVKEKKANSNIPSSLFIEPFSLHLLPNCLVVKALLLEPKNLFPLTLVYTLVLVSYIPQVSKFNWYLSFTLWFISFNRTPSQFHPHCSKKELFWLTVRCYYISRKCLKYLFQFFSYQGTHSDRKMHSVIFF